CARRDIFIAYFDSW
nr:immunoglobulin heavy chain junction region [Macaca mulatta]